MSSRKIVAEGLVKRHGSLLALNGVGFELEKRRCLAVVGPNGAGKSSLLRILAGVSLPDEGRVAGLRGFPDRLPSRRPRPSRWRECEVLARQAQRRGPGTACGE